MFLKQAILKTFYRLGYVLFQKKAFAYRAKQTETPAIRQEWLEDVKLVSSRYSVLELLPKAERVAEIGVGYGDFSKKIIQALEPNLFVAIDTFDGDENDKWGAPLKEHKMSHKEYYLYNVGLLNGQQTIETFRGLSWDGIAKYDDLFFDYIYVDADHSYECVKKDITAASSKVKVGGYMQCNDFTHFDTDNYVHYGVPRAVFELLETETYKMCYFCLAPNGFYDVVLQRRK